MRRLLIVVATVLAMVGVAQAGAPGTRPTTRPVKITILDTAGKAIPNATIKPDGKGKETVRTADDGSADVMVDRDEANVYLHLAADGYAPKRLIWSKYNEAADAKPENMPDAVTVRLENAVPIGGKVIDDAGQPVEGAAVVLHIYDKSQRRSVESLDISYIDVKTAADGTWTYPTAPPKFENILVGVHHPDYLSSSGNNGFFPMNDVKDIATLRDRSHVDTLIRGVMLEGTVYGVDGKPLAKAKLGVGSDRVASNVLPDVKTDENGKYHMAVDPASPAVLTVRAKGHSPVAKTVNVTKPMTLDFHLQAASTIRGRVIDPDGIPVANAHVYFDEWQGFRTISHTSRTDKDGRFSWNEAPADKVKADVDALGFARERDVWLMPSKDESDVTTIKIHRPTQVTGSVVDAETGEPIKVFKVITGIWWNDQQAIAWQRRGDDERKGADGKFEFKVTWPYPGHKVLIEADGYLPAESRVFKNDEQKVALEIKLTRGEGYKGIVRDAAGKPTKAKLVIATPTAMAYLMNGTEYREQGGVSCDAGEDGTYSLPAQIGKWAIVAFSDYGYAEVTPEQMAKSKDISLQPWGKVEGVAMIGTKPAAGAELQIYDNRPFDENSPRIYHQQEAKADKDGKFHFDRVRPGDIFVARTVRQGMMSTSTSPVKTSVKPGETVQVTVGGKGRPVVGRIQLPADLAGRDDWQYAMCMMHPKVDYPKPPQVPDEVKGDMEKTKAWYEQWTKSPEGEAYQAAVRKISEANRSYPVVVDPSGTFRADDVEPGTYTVNIQIAERPKERTCGFGESIATGELKFTVAAMSDGRSDEPQDVGTVEVQTLKTVKPGDVAPPIAGKLLDGQDFTLESLKGKYVVLDFWATWCGPCVAEIPNMKSTYEAFAKNEKFAMVSISLDEDAATAKKFTEKQQMAWTQVHLPGVWENAAAKAYGVRGIPSIWLIGPDGKVLEKDLRGEAVKQAIERHLSQ